MAINNCSSWLRQGTFLTFHKNQIRLKMNEKQERNYS